MSVLFCAAGLVLCAAALLELAYLVGRKSPENPSAVEAVRVAASSPGIALTTACGALLLGACCLRRLALHRLAHRPGRIEVAQFTAGTQLTDVDLEKLTVGFRRRLATLCLNAPTPVPGAAAASDFFDVLGQGGSEPSSIVGLLLGLLRVARPTHAFEVDGVLLERAQAPRYGVDVEVRRLPSGSTLIPTIWDDSWDVALRRAADEATAVILPQTRLCRAPWSAWRGHVMPSGLLHAYEEGVRYERERRYDEALDAYYRAVELDPMNMVLRLRLGQLQERLGLYLDAFATYWGMRSTSRPAGARPPRLLHLGRSGWERRRALLSARYRRIVLLGGRVFAKQWLTGPVDIGNPTRRDEQRERLRQCLRPHLTRKLMKIEEDHDLIAAALAEPTEPHADDSVAFLQLRALLARYALYDSERLRRRMRRGPFDRRTLTPATVLLTEQCIETRLTWVKAQHDKTVAWPPDPEEMTTRIRGIELGGLRRLRAIATPNRSFQRWHEHYNAACVYALPLMDREIDDDDRRPELATRAVRRLEKATTRADSAFIASRRDWLVSEDPDLKGLRAHGRFEEFEVMYLPSGRLTPRRPRTVQQLESSRYVRALLVETANPWQRVWHRRAAVPPDDVHVLIDWFGDELRMWELVRDVARHYCHSRTRIELLAALRACADRYAFAAPEVRFPRYDVEPLSTGDCDDAAEAAIKAGNARLEAIAAILRDHSAETPAGLRLDDLAAWQATLRRLDATARPAAPELVAELCEHHAALWQLLELWLNAPADAAAGPERQFRDMARRTRKLWRARPDLRSADDIADAA
jgi:hypothetical protein